MSFLNDLTMQQILTRLVGFLVISGVHGVLLAGLARLFGDRGPAYDGRLTINPFVHLSMPAMAMAILFQIGWIRPVDISPEHLRGGRWGLVLVAVLALALTLLLVPLLGLLRPLSVTMLTGSASLTVLNLLTTAQGLTLWFVVANVLPLPVLTGAQFLVAAWPPIKPYLNRHVAAAMTVLVVLLVLGLPTALLEPVFIPLRDMMIGR